MNLETLNNLLVKIPIKLTRCADTAEILQGLIINGSMTDI
jgi:hypothetical protein